MSAKQNTALNHCLYFTCNTFSRLMTKMAEEEFRLTGLSPSHAFLLITVIENEGVSPKELSSKLEIAPSTVTRFLDYLQNKKLIVRETEGKTSKIYSTSKGQELQETIKHCWKNLYSHYIDKIGEVQSSKLVEQMNSAINKLT